MSYEDMLPKITARTMHNDERDTAMKHPSFLQLER